MVTITTLVKENKGRFIAFDKKKYAAGKKKHKSIAENWDKTTKHNLEPTGHTFWGMLHQLISA